MAGAASIVLNFVMLVGVVLLVYVAQIASNQDTLQPFDPHGYLVAMGLWMSLYGIVLMLLGGMTALAIAFLIPFATLLVERIAVPRILARDAR